MTAAKFETIVARQLPEAEKRARADFVADTSETVENCHNQIDFIIASFKGRRGEAFDRHWRG